MGNLLGHLERVLGNINASILKVCRWLAILLLAVMTTIILSNVFYRYVLDDALPWSEEIAKYLMVWLTFVAAPLAFRMGALVSIQALPNALDGRKNEILQIIIQLIIISLMVMFVDIGIFLTKNAMIQRASSVNFSISYVYASMPIGALMILSVSLQFLLAALRRLVNNDPRPSDPDAPDVVPTAD
jgi:TRAP-type C4-dicarboxylate transport system permease small subunit